MNGKTLKVVEYNLTFGSNARMVHVFGCFKYKKNNNLYLVYADVDSKIPIVYYGSSHIKENSILSMECRDSKEEEIIKEYIFKVTNQEVLENFEMISLTDISGVEIISSNKLEVKEEVINSLVDLTIPKPEEKEREKTKEKPKKKKHKNLFIFLLILIVLGGGYLYFSTLSPKDQVSKTIVCSKMYHHDKLNATVEEENTYNFNYQDSLESIDTVMVYQFNEEDYLDFINKGTYYKYMPESDTEGGFDKDDDLYRFKIITKERVDSSYNKPTNYEEVFSYYKGEGYTCNENIEKEQYGEFLCTLWNG